jgi:hypothetical protein
MKRFFIIIASVALIGLSSCEKYLDVRPKSQIPADLHFSRESGFLDQLTGVYTKMIEPAMYGREMTFGLIEVLSQNYNLGVTNAYRDAAAYDYFNTTVRPKIDAIWSNTYNCIARLNMLLEYHEKANPNIFRDDNRNLIEGEALGLRAFLHFDLLRIFSPSYASNPNALAIPFVTEYAPKVTPQLTVAQTLDLIIQDLERALVLLESDYQRPGVANSTHRKAFFNYYATVGTLARAYMWKGDHVNALKYAMEIVDEGEQGSSSMFRWVSVQDMETPIDGNRDQTFTHEQIFYLSINGMADNVNPWFTRHSSTGGTVNPNALLLSDAKRETVFELPAYGNDYRAGNWNFLIDGGARYFSKFWQFENGRFNNRFPLMRKTEAYYIVAEILKHTEKEVAIEYLNLVRSHRRLGQFPLPWTLSVERVQEEIFKEYRKDYLGEGQLFFYYKRLNLPTIEGAAVPADDRIYVLPMPDNEIEFGHRK